MKKERKKAIKMRPELSASGQIDIDFSYLDYLCVSDSTVLGHLQFRPPEEAEAKSEESAIALS